MRGPLLRLHKAVKALARVKDGKTLFEHSPTKDQECFDAWKELNEAQRNAALVLQIDRDPDIESEAGVLHPEAPAQKQ